MNRQVDYKIYPSLLDSYQRYLNADVEGLWWQDDKGWWHKNYDESTGEYHYTPEEAENVILQDLLNSINRVPFTSEAASKGTAFNKAIDDYISGLYEINDTDTMIEAEADGMTFAFNPQLIKSIGDRFRGALSQVFTKATIDTCYGAVELYGYIDELLRDKVYDLKTTSSYSFGKYEDHWQRHVYPYCLVKSGVCMDISSFEYTVIQLNKGQVITGREYREEYTFNFEQSERMIREFLERFIEFLNNHREDIVVTKLFGNE